MKNMKCLATIVWSAGSGMDIGEEQCHYERYDTMRKVLIY